MEVIDRGLHPAEDGQSLDEDEDEDDPHSSMVLHSPSKMNFVLYASIQRHVNTFFFFFFLEEYVSTHTHKITMITKLMDCQFIFYETLLLSIFIQQC